MVGQYDSIFGKHKKKNVVIFAFLAIRKSEKKSCSFKKLNTKNIMRRHIPKQIKLSIVFVIK